MSITIDIDPNLEAALRARAEAAGVSLEEYFQRLAKRDVEAPSTRSRAEAKKIFESLRGQLGPVPERALDPEFLYGDS